MKTPYKDWGDVYCAALRRGLDNGYAAWLADRWEKKKNLERGAIRRQMSSPEIDLSHERKTGREKLMAD